MRATGVVALVLLTGTMVLGILTAGRTASRSWPAFARADLHKRVSLLAMVFLALHVLTAVLDTYVNVGWASVVVPFASPYRPLWTGLGTVGVDLMVAVAVSSALRQRISPRTWRGIHWLAYGSWPVAMAHSLGMGTDASTLWMDVLAAVCTVAVAGRAGLAHRRPPAEPGAGPLVGRRHPGRHASGRPTRPGVRRPGGRAPLVPPGPGAVPRPGRPARPPDCSRRIDHERRDPRCHRPAAGRSEPGRRPAPTWPPIWPRTGRLDLPRTGRPRWRAAMLAGGRRVRAARTGGCRLPVRRQVGCLPPLGPPTDAWWSTPWRASRPAPRTASC